MLLGYRFRNARYHRCGGGGREIAVHEPFVESGAQTRLATGAVHRNEHADFFIQHQQELAVEELGVAAMRNDATPVVVGLVETKHHAVQRTNAVSGAGFVHLLGGRRRK